MAGYINTVAQKDNFKAFLKWLNKNQRKIKPDGRKIKIFFADRMINMGEIGKKARSIAKEEGSEDLGAHVAKMENLVKVMTQASKGGGEAKYASIFTMLEKWTNTIPGLIEPKTSLVHRRSRNMLDYVKLVSENKGNHEFFDRTDRKKVWPRLSKIYAKNTEGEIEILRSGLHNIHEAVKTSDLIRVELKELQKNQKISKTARRIVAVEVEKILEALERETKRSEKATADAIKMISQGL
ncbi:hypothetical protein [Leisingera caerulea]|uniref:Uncharacterized protein n=1 Tax=Leisingera caerulea TaxID=506591 RepID=A0A9Q9HGL6_LEICA|nr:hypothetical protein [Leisingera caerulea]UWQ54734.1 hypothetical protein K3721_04175 [Leisingera caerulea]